MVFHTVYVSIRLSLIKLGVLLWIPIWRGTRELGWQHKKIQTMDILDVVFCLEANFKYAV